MARTRCQYIPCRAPVVAHAAKRSTLGTVVFRLVSPLLTIYLRKLPSRSKSAWQLRETLSPTARVFARCQPCVRLIFRLRVGRRELVIVTFGHVAPGITKYLYVTPPRFNS